MKRNVKEEDEMITRRMESTSLKTLLTLHFHSSKAASSSSSSSFLPPFSFSHFKNKNNKTTFNLSFSARCSLSERGEQESCLPNGVGQVVREVPHNRLLQVVLVSPQIPGNTGCIARTCAASGVGLHLVEPLGFKVEDTKLKRAGLDYWPYVVVKVHSSWTDFQEYFRLQEGEKRLLAFTKRGTTIHSDFSYQKGDWLVFGAETFGLPPEALHDCKNEPYGGGAIRIPMTETYVRCLNLSVSVGISLYEASRQLNYEQLQNLPEPCADGSSKPFITEDVFA